jgi:outer membrane protein TolC
MLTVVQKGCCAGVRKRWDQSPQTRPEAVRRASVRCCLSVLALLPLLAACSTARRLERLNRRTAGELDAVQRTEFPGQPPETLALDAYEPFTKPAGDGVLRLDLRQALAVGARHSRQYQTAREALYRSALGLVSARHDWDWLPANSFSALVGRDLKGPDTTLDTDASAGLSKRFISGARLSGSLAFYGLRYLSGDHAVSLGTLGDVTLTQPLLAGADAEVVREPLTQSERDLVYALRAFVRERKSLLINIADTYYSVLSALDSLEIARRNHINLKDSRERSEAMAESGRVPLFQVDQARQRELDAQSSLVLREEAFQARKDDLKEALGVPLEVPIELERADLDRLAAAALPQPPMDLEQAAAYAFEHRLDWATERDQLADAQRHARIAADAVRAQLDLKLSATAASPTDDHLRRIALDEGTYAAGITGELPLDRTAELVSYRRALISEAQQQRNLSQAHDRIVADIRNVWRRLKSSEQNYQIQRLSVDLAKKRVESTELLFQAGRVDIREVLDARDALISAENALTVALVEHRMNWLQLMYQLEQLPTEPDTLWSPALAVQPPPDGATP